MKRILFFLALAGLLSFAVISPAVTANGDCQFTLFGDMQTDTDPENPSNEVLSIDPEFVGDFGGVRKTLPGGTKAPDIDIRSTSSTTSYRRRAARQARPVSSFQLIVTATVTTTLTRSAALAIYRSAAAVSLARGISTT